MTTDEYIWKENLQFHESDKVMNSKCFTELEAKVPHSSRQKLHIAIISLCIDVYVLKYYQPQTLKLGSILRCLFVLSHRGYTTCNLVLLNFDFILFILKRIMNTYLE